MNSGNHGTIALQAAVMNLLSIGAAYGVIVAIFQWGWGASLIGVHTTLPIPAYVPMLVFAIVFGLSMDYEVFLLSRVHEAWIETGDPHRAVAVGIGATARVITTAAAIMVVVFASFVLSTDPTVKMLAIGMAFAVLIDASLVRMILVPSIMALLDARAWWMPRWMEPIVPQLQLEGSTVPAASAAPAVPAPAGPAQTKAATEAKAAAYRLVALREYQGTLVLKVDVDGAQVFVDGKAMGMSPVRMQLHGDRANVEVRRAGYAAVAQTVTLDHDQHLVLTLSRQLHRASSKSDPKLDDSFHRFE